MHESENRTTVLINKSGGGLFTLTVDFFLEGQSHLGSAQMHYTKAQQKKTKNMPSQGAVAHPSSKLVSFCFKALHSNVLL